MSAVTKIRTEPVRLRLRSLARGISGNYRAELRWAETSNTDGKLIQINPNPAVIAHLDLPIETRYAMVRATTIHEALHILLTSFQAWLKYQDDPELKAYFHPEVIRAFGNILEDARIEFIGCQMYDGARVWITLSNVTVIKARKVPEPKEENLTNALIEGFLARSVAGFLQDGFAEAWPQVTAFLDEVEPLIEEGRRAKTSERCFEIAKEILLKAKALLPKYEPPTFNLEDLLNPDMLEGLRGQEADYDEVPGRDPRLKPRLSPAKPNGEEEGQGTVVIIKVPGPGAGQDDEGEEAGDGLEAAGSFGSQDHPSADEADLGAESAGETSEAGEAGTGSLGGPDDTDAPSGQEEAEAGGAGSGGSGQDEQAEGQGAAGGESSEDPSEQGAQDGGGTDSGEATDQAKTQGGGNNSGGDGSGEEASGPSDENQGDGKGADGTGQNPSGTSADTSEDASTSQGGPEEPVDAEDLSCGNSRGGDTSVRGGQKDWTDEEIEELVVELTSLAEAEWSQVTAEAPVEVPEQIDEGPDYKALERDLANLPNHSQARLNIIDASGFLEPYQKALEVTQLARRQMLARLKPLVVRQAEDFQTQLRRGSLDPRRLWRVPTLRETHVFQQRKVPHNPAVAAYILADASGSMNAPATFGGVTMTRAAAVRLTMVTVADVLEQLNIVHAASAYDEWEYVNHRRLLKFGQRSNRETVMDYRPGGENRDGYSIRVATAELAKRREPVKILFVLSDGQPAAAGYYSGTVDSNGVVDTAQAVQEARSQGIYTLGFYFGSHDPHSLEIEVAMFGRQWLIVVNDLTTLASNMASMFRQIVNRHRF